MPRGALAHQRQRVLEQQPQVEAAQLELHAPGLDLRQVEDVVDQRQQVVARRVDVLQVLELLFVDLAEHLLGQHLGEADDRVERRAQLVAHVGEEFRLVAIRVLELAALVLDLVEQPDLLDADRRLVGKRLQQADLVIGRRAGVGPCDDDRAEHAPLAQHRHTEQAAPAAGFRKAAVVVHVRKRVIDAHDRLRQDHPPAGHALVRRHRESILQRLRLGRQAVARGQVHQRAVVVEHRRQPRLAQIDGAAQDGIEHRLHVGLRPRHHAQDLRSRGLPLERLLRLVEQPHVLDRNRRLVGKRRQQHFVDRRHRPRLPPRDDDCAEDPALAHQRNAQHAPPAACLGKAAVVGGILQRVFHAHDRSFQNHASGYLRTVGPHRVLLVHEGELLRCDVVVRDVVQLLAVVAEQVGEQAVAQRHRASHDRVEHRLHVGRRFADDLENLGGRRLPLERFLGLVEQPHVFDRNDRLVGKGPQQVDLPLRRLSRVGPGDHNRADRGALLQQRRPQHAPPLPAACKPLVIAGVCQRVFFELNAPRQDDPSAHHLRIRRTRVQAARILERLGRPVARRHHVHEARVVAEDRRQRLIEQARSTVQDRFEDGRDIGRRLADHAQHAADRGLVVQRLAEFGGSLLDLALEPCVGGLELRAHLVELLGQRLQLVAGGDLDALVEVPRADLCGAFLNRTDRAHQRARKKEARGHGDHQACSQQASHAQHRRIQRCERLGAR